MIWLNGQLQSAQTLDRGLLYGDGFFTTILLIRNKIANWSGHWQRLQQSAKRLGFPELDQQVLLQDLRRAIVQAEVSADYAVAKLIVTRGVGGKGYQPAEVMEPNYYMQILPFPSTAGAEKVVSKKSQAWYLFKTELTWSEVQATTQPLLAGIKHLNRLDNVLAQQQLAATAYDEAVMLDGDGHCISGTQANLCMIQNQRIISPDLSCCGVEGTALKFLKNLPNGYELETAKITPQQLLVADEVFLCNALRGVMPVLRIDDNSYPTEKATELAQLWMDAMNEALI